MYRVFKNVIDKPAQAVLRASGLVTLLLSRLGVNFPTASQDVIVSTFSCSNISTGTWHRQDGKWVRKRPLEPLVGGGALLLGSGVDTDSDDDEDEPLPLAPSSTAPGPSSSFSQSFEERVETCLTDVETAIQGLKTDMETQFRRMHSDLDLFFNLFFSVHPCPPPPPSS